uniref:Uncharacterized protein LOC100376393 n=1 Tax=Saccoglossus kowalevskii TaxID=10224 RepID=A0ABM0MZF8_SACKO|nr:PREDICTED: uncharacterized protein LOC100376393 [Saccoglossus kowalevskii]
MLYAYIVWVTVVNISSCKECTNNADLHPPSVLNNGATPSVGADVELLCQTTDINKNYKYGWYFEGNEVLSDGPHLRILNITVDNVGKYQCEVKGECGMSSLSDMMYLNIDGVIRQLTTEAPSQTDRWIVIVCNNVILVIMCVIVGIICCVGYYRNKKSKNARTYKYRKTQNNTESGTLEMK